jgi:peptidoglycan/LPS O-acetylase OafA/YrhL
VTTDPSSQANGRWPVLDGLRAVSILAVIGFHAQWPGFGGGGRGVDLFFVISGFLITWLLVKERERTGRVSLKKFYFRRVLRIVPAFFVFLLGYGLVCLLVFRDLKPKLASSLLIATTYTTNAMMGWFGRDVVVAHTWSLSAEEQFYAVWPWFVGLLPRRAATLTTGALVAFALVWRLVLFASIGLSGPPMRYAYSPDTRFDSILWGCLLAYMVSHRRLGPALRKIFRKGFAVVLGVGLVSSSILVSQASKFFESTFAYTVTALGAGVILMGALYQEDSWLGRQLSSKVVQWVGRLSYSLYLWHTVALALASRATNQVGVAARAPALALSYIALAFGFAAGSYYLVEKPFLRMKTRFAVVQAT